jgi:MFS family permease
MHRPPSLIVFGVLNLVFAAFTVFGLAISGVMLAVQQNQQVPNPAWDLMRSNPNYYAYVVVSSLLSLVAAAVLALAGAGLLMVRPWGRYLSISYALYAILAAVVGGIVGYVYVTAPLLEKAARAQPGPEQLGMQIGAYATLFGTGIGLIYPVLLLVFMYRPGVLAAMQVAREEGQQPA